MSIKRILLLILFFFSISLFTPKISKAVDFGEILTSENSIVVKVQEGIEYFFAFKVENKVEVLEKHAEKRLVMAQSYADEGNNERVQSVLQNYLQIKERQNILLEDNKSGEVLGAVEERTIEQQKTMEEIKTKIDEDGKRNVVQVQEQVVNQVAQRVIDINGKEGQTEFFNKVEHVWAPGTGPGGGESGVVVVGGTMQFAPGTSAGGSSGSDIKTVEIKTGGGDGGGTTVVEGGNQGSAPSGGDTGVQNADPGTNDTRTWIDP